MKRRSCMIVTITLLLLFAPVLAQAHLLFWEGEIFRKYGEPIEDWGTKVEGINGAFGADPTLGGEDWSFDYPFIIPPGEGNLSRMSLSHLARGDVDVIKYTAAEGEEICLALFCMVPACIQYRNFYPAVGILGPAIPAVDEFPFEYPEDCKDCGFMRTHPTRVRWTERPVQYGPTGAVPDLGYWWIVDWETDGILDYHLKGPGNFYIVIYEPEGKSGDYSMNFGWDECETHYKPEDIAARKWWAYIADDLKWTRVRCRKVEGSDYNDLPDSSKFPVPPPCGPPMCPPEE